MHLISKLLSIFSNKFIKLLIVALIIYYLINSRKLDIDNLYFSLNSLYVLYGVLLLALIPFLFSIRWMLLLIIQKVILSFSKICQLTFMALFFDTILPPGGADIARGYYLNKSLPYLNNRIAAFGSILFDRVIGLFSLLIIAIVGLFLNIKFFISLKILGNTLYLLIIASSIFIVIIIFVLCLERYRSIIMNYLSNNPHIAHMVNLYNSLRAYKENYPYIFYVFLISCVGHILTFLAIFLFAKALGEVSLTFRDYMGILPISFLCTQIPIGPGFIGIGLLSFYSFFKIAGSNYGSDIFAMYLCMRIMTTLPGGYFYIFFRDVPDLRHV
jgi:uncharacterized protein (TIRG00374 family)